MDEWIMKEWMDEWMNEWMHRFISGWMNVVTDNGQIDRYINIDGQTNRRIILIRFIPIHKFLHRPFKSIFLLSPKYISLYIHSKLLRS